MPCMMFITGLAFLLSRHLCVQNVVCVCVCVFVCVCRMWCVCVCVLCVCRMWCVVCVCVCVWGGEGDQFDTLYQWMGTVDC